MKRLGASINIELTNACNFSCVYCPINKMTRRKGFMEFNLAKHIIDEVAETQVYHSVAFHIMGEPLLHPHIIDLTEYASQKGLKVHLVTNGAFLEKKIDGLLDAGVARITISLETPSEESFKSRRTKVIDYTQYI